MYIRCSEDVQEVFWTPYVYSIYILCPRGGKYPIMEKMKQRLVTSFPVSLFNIPSITWNFSMVPLILKNNERSHNIAPATGGWFLHIGGFPSPALNMSNTWSTWNQWIYYKNSRRCPLTKTPNIMRWYVCLLKKWAFNDNKVVEGF